MYLQSYLQYSHHNKEFAYIKLTNILMRVSRHVVAKLLIVNRMFKRDYQNKVLPFFYLSFCIRSYRTNKVVCFFNDKARSTFSVFIICSHT